MTESHLMRCLKDAIKCKVGVWFFCLSITSCKCFCEEKNGEATRPACICKGMESLNEGFRVCEEVTTRCLADCTGKRLLEFTPLGIQSLGGMIILFNRAIKEAPHKGPSCGFNVVQEVHVKGSGTCIWRWCTKWILRSRAEWLKDVPLNFCFHRHEMHCALPASQETDMLS